MDKSELYLIQTRTKYSDWKTVYKSEDEESIRYYLKFIKRYCDEINSDLDEGMEWRIVKRKDEVIG